MEGAEEMENLLTLFLFLFPKADFSLLMSLDELGATLDLALVVACLQLVALDWLLGDERECYKLVHEHVEHRVVMTPVAVLQPEPLEGILLFHGDELLSEGIHVGSFSHLLLDECNETLWIDFQFNLLAIELPEMFTRQR